MTNPARSQAITTVIRCGATLASRTRYVLDTLFMALGRSVVYSDEPPRTGIWVLYADSTEAASPMDRCVWIVHDAHAWARPAPAAAPRLTSLDSGTHDRSPSSQGGLNSRCCIDFDLPAAAFHVLASVREREIVKRSQTRILFSESVFAREDIPQDVVDRCMALLQARLSALSQAMGLHPTPDYPSTTRQFSVALTHDVDFLPSGLLDTLVQGAKTVLRHGLRQRDPRGAVLAGRGLVAALATGRDPYGCIPEIIAAESVRGVRSSFQVAVARRHPADVNYDIRDDRVRDYLRAITDAGFDLCLHGSYRSTERIDWYVEEADLLAKRLARPLGSRQHYLSFDYDMLFKAQEVAGIRYDMSIGFPDRCGPRAGFSFPYFPYCLEEDRPYDVLEIPLFFMDVTLQSYMRLSAAAAREVLETGLQDLRRKGGAVSMVWHPIVFGGARDPGYDGVYWDMVERIAELGGLATDARSIHDRWRRRALGYASFARLTP